MQHNLSNRYKNKLYVQQVEIFSQTYVEHL